MKKVFTLITLFIILFVLNGTERTHALFQNDKPIDTIDRFELYVMDWTPTIKDVMFHKQLPTSLIHTPDTFNWKDIDGQDWTTPAKDQGNCGSCWDFAAIGTLESIMKIRENNSEIQPDLSEQYVLSCLPAAANHYGEGCMGGTPYNAFRCMMDMTEIGNYHNGALPEYCMPYQADDDVPCEAKYENWTECLIPICDCGEQWVGFDNLSARETIKSLIYQHGPIASGINVTSEFIQWGSYHHRDTEYYPNTNEQWGNRLNHIIVIVGWKDDSSIENGGYWICKNSWGTEWGYEGFFNIEYGGLFTASYIAWVDYIPYNLRPLKPETPIGPSAIKINTEYDFSCVSSDPEQDTIYYLFDWDDGTNSGWIGPCNSGEPCTASHIWIKKGHYEIRVMAKDIHFYESQWSDQLSLSMPYRKITSIISSGLFPALPFPAFLRWRL